MTPDVDVAIAGAGPAGAAAALYAARAGLQVAVFDRAEFPRDKICGEGLMPPGRTVLDEIGLSTIAADIEAELLEGVEFTVPGGHPRGTAFPRGRGPVEALGVRRLRFDAALIERLQANARVAFHPETAVQRVIPGNGRRPALVTSKGEVRARYVVVADGLRSSLRHQLGWTIGPKPPNRYGVSAHWHVDGPQRPRIQITIGQGLEVYEAPVGPGERLVSVLCRQERMHAFGGRLAEEYCSVVRAHIPALANAGPFDEVRAIGPFNYRARTVARAGVFLVGDAAGFVDPISAEGLAAALLQARSAVRTFGATRPEAAYRAVHRRLTRDPRRISMLMVLLASTPGRTERGLRGIDRRPRLMASLVGINFGYWGFDRISARDWLALFTGR